MSGNIAGIFSNTKNNVVRNKWLSIATILVTIIVFTTASIFIILSLIAHRAVKVSETKAQLQIYFQLDTPEEEILKVEERVKGYSGTESTTYISQEEALRLYISYYSDDPDLLDNVSADWLPASLEVRAKSLEQLDGLTEVVKEEQNTNPYIEDVQYHEDIVRQLRSISRTISSGALAIIVVFSTITFALIFITISFNIRSHKNEIEIMHLVGSSDAYIKVPFILEGTFYTMLGSFLASIFILVPWLIFMRYGIGTNLHFIVTDILKELSLDYIRDLEPLFLLSFFGIHLLIGALVGIVASSIAVVKHLDLKEK